METRTNDKEDGMKILEQGKQPGEMWPYTLTLHCYRCGCKFKLEETDHGWRKEMTKSWDQRDNVEYEDGEQVVIDCPNCGKQVTGK